MPAGCPSPSSSPERTTRFPARSIDPDALKVLTRLHDANYTAYLVGGSVRDLLLGRRPKDFDVGTSAHPYQIKKLFRNCWIIGRRFRLAHVKFGDKAIEVATFRQHVPVGRSRRPTTPSRRTARSSRRAERRDLLIHRDNTFGTPEEDAFRRDFTVNALFYDIADRSIIDYVGGLDDIRARVDPFDRRSQRTLPGRSGAHAARGGAGGAARLHARSAGRGGHQVAPAPAGAGLAGADDRGVLQGAALGRGRAHVPGAGPLRLLEPVTPELQEHADDEGFLDALDALDTYRQRFDSAPPTLTNAILLGTMVVPLGLMPTRERTAAEDGDGEEAEEDA